MDTSVVGRIGDLLDNISGLLIFAEDDDDRLETALRLMKETPWSAEEITEIKEHFNDALRRTKLLSEGSWFHTQLQNAYNAQFKVPEISP